MTKNAIIISIAWLLLISALFTWSYSTERENHRQMALRTARAFFSQIVLDRAWNASHGGVYVPITEKTRPNQYLNDPNRDLLTDKGVKLTKINPAFMTRQIAEIARKQKGVQFHITSLQPIRPENKATTWEAEWLKAFQQGATERGRFVRQGRKIQFQYMAPLMVEKSCLSCHAAQGYKEGDIRGGISVTLPFLSRPHYTGLLVGYGSAAVAGVILIVISSFLLERKNRSLQMSNNALMQEIDQRVAHQKEQAKLIDDLRRASEKVKTLEGILPLCSYCRKIRKPDGDQLKADDWLDFEEYLGRTTSAECSHSICPECLKKHFPDVL